MITNFPLNKIEGTKEWLANIPWDAIRKAADETFRMLWVSLGFTVLFGLLLGVLLYLTSAPQMRTNSKWFNTLMQVVYIALSFSVNVLRSVPFVILMILIMPMTKQLVGTSIGVEGSIPPLIVAAAPFFARLVEVSLREVDRGVIEAAQAMGASKVSIILRVLLPEARTGIIAAMTITAVTLVSYTAMSGVIGGGGLGDLAIRYGYQRFQTDVMIVTVVLLIILVQLLQMVGDTLVRRFSRR